MSSMMSVLCRTAAMGAEGAKFLESNQFEEAYDYFAKALDLIVRAENTWLRPMPIFVEGKVAVVEAAATSVAAADLNPAAMDGMIKMLPKHQAATNTTSTCVNALNTELRIFQDDAFFVYDEPLLFVPEPDVTKQNVSFYKAVMLFNVALTLHKKSRCVDSWSVYRALHFYELCLEYIKECPGHANCLELSAAALNNKAHIYYEHGEFDTTRSVLDTLLVNMIFTHGRPLEFEERNTQGILFNLYMLRMPTSARTA